MSIGKNIRLLRVKHSLHQSELATSLNVSPKTISTWENDIQIPRMPMIEKIAQYFNVSKSYIIEDIELIDPMTKRELQPIKDDNTKQSILFRKIDGIDQRKKDKIISILDKDLEKYLELLDD